MSRMASNVKKTCVYLFRNDLRVHDNECLRWANRNSDYVVPLYCFEPHHYKGTYHFDFPKTAIHRAKFNFEAVSDLRKNLQKFGSNLLVRHTSITDAISEVIRFCAESSAPVDSVVYQQEVTQEETDQEKKLSKMCKEHNINLQSFWGLTLFHIEDIPFKKSNIPDTYTQFRKGVEGGSKVRPVLDMPTKFSSLPPDVDLNVGDLPQLTELGYDEDNPDFDTRTAVPFIGGETTGLQRLNDYLWGTDAIATYKETRNGLVGEDYSTKFSPWLANGSLSPREIYKEVKRYEESRVENQSTYWCIFELIWRDYFKYVCLRYGDSVFDIGGVMGKHIPWKNDMELFKKWSQGKTGVPFVDANMRELLHTGWMSNRGRQNVASFLVKDLNIDWRMGAEWFESMLLDHDVCSNYGNWNYAAGIGNDPRENRKFNMIKQGLDYDAEGKFVKLWIPELANIPNGGKVHMPWEISDKDLEGYNISLGTDYPRPVLIAPEWNRHKHKAQGRPNNQQQKKQQRGVDFYFKADNKKK